MKKLLIGLIGLIGLISFIGLIPLKAQAVDIVDGDLIRAQGTLDVYIVKIVGDKKFKRLILNPEIFNQYGHLKWEDIKDVEESIIDNYSTSNLVRSVDDEKVYSLYPNEDTGEKRWVKTADDFLDLGYDWDAIYTINNFERDAYSIGEDLEAPKAPEEPEESEEPEEPEIPSREPMTINVPEDYSTIQAAIDAAIDGDTISVETGTYNENIVINKNIKLIGSYAVSAIIDGQGNGPAITIIGADDFLIQKFTLKSGNGKAIYCSGENLSKGTIKNTIIKDSDWGIFIEGNCDLVILNNQIYNNRDSSNTDGAGILVRDNSAYDFTLEIRNNTIDDNYHGVWSENANLKVMNSIITNNTGGNNSTGLYHDGDSEMITMYNNVWHNGFNYGGDASAGAGSLVVDPEFSNQSHRDYRLKWGTTYYSKCIDAGHSSYIYNDGTLVTSNVYRNDMGAYGGPDNIGW